MSVKLTPTFIVRLVIVAALAVLGIWIARNTYWDEITVPKPLSGEAATNPFYTAQHLADKLGARSEWRHVLGTPPSNSSIIVLQNWDWDVVPTRREQLEQWVEQGGRLVLDDSLLSDAAFKEWSGISRLRPKRTHKTKDDDENGDDQQESDDNDKSAPKSLIERLQRFAVGNCVQVANTHTASQQNEPDSYQLCNINSGATLESDRSAVWTLRDERGLQAVRVNVGRGSITKINARPFGNRQLFNGDNAMVFVAAAQLKRGDAIYFLSEEERESLLALTWRYGAPAVLLSLAAVALVLWRDSVRFGPLAAVIDSARRSLAEQIRGTGEFTMHFGGGRALHAATVRAVHEAAAKHLMKYPRLSNEERIAMLAQHTHVPEAELAHAMNYAGPRRAADLRSAIALLERVRRHLVDSKR